MQWLNKWCDVILLFHPRLSHLPPAAIVVDAQLLARSLTYLLACRTHFRTHAARLLNAKCISVKNYRIGHKISNVALISWTFRRYMWKSAQCLYVPKCLSLNTNIQIEYIMFSERNSLLNVVFVDVLSIRALNILILLQTTYMHSLHEIPIFLLFKMWKENPI